MRADDEGFLQPAVQESLCIECDLCEKVCPVLHPGEPREPLAVYAAKALDDELRMKSSSGGVFSLLSREVFAKGGIVYGAGWEKPTWRVVHKSAENEEELSDLRGSKYVQSDMGSTYSQAKEQLSTGRLVMFTGCPCQIAGLKRYLRQDYENLLCVDLICHGVPSPLVFERYKEEKVKESAASISQIDFRNKRFGWNLFSFSMVFENGVRYLQDLNRDIYLKGFSRNLYLRRSCYQCSFLDCRSQSDLTLADYWNVRQRFPEMDDDVGTSLILVQTSRGKRFSETIRPHILQKSSDYQDACRGNPVLVRSVEFNVRRDKFLKEMRSSSASIDALVSKFSKISISERIGRRILRLLRKRKK